MGNAGGRCRPSQPRPQPTVPTAVVRDVAIPPGCTVPVICDLPGGLGTKIELQNVGAAAGEFAERDELTTDQPVLAGEGHILRPGKTTELKLRDGSHKLVLAITSAKGTKVKLVVAPGRPAPSPTYILSRRKVIERDPKTQVIKSIMEVPVWIRQEPR